MTEPWYLEFTCERYGRGMSVFSNGLHCLMCVGSPDDPELVVIQDIELIEKWVDLYPGFDLRDQAFLDPYNRTFRRHKNLNWMKEGF